MPVQYKKRPLKKKTKKKKQFSQVAQNNPLFSSVNDSFENTPRPNWEIQWEIQRKITYNVIK